MRSHKIPRTIGWKIFIASEGIARVTHRRVTHHIYHLKRQSMSTNCSESMSLEFNELISFEYLKYIYVCLVSSAVRNYTRSVGGQVF